MVLKIEDDGGNVLQKNSPSITSKTGGKSKVTAFWSE